MPSSEPEHSVLHVYAQHSHHGEAYIAGNRRALIDLRHTIDEALALGDGEMRTFANDGEGYELQVVMVTEAQAAKLATGYTADYAQDPDGLHPWTILNERYQARENDKNKEGNTGCTPSTS